MREWNIEVEKERNGQSNLKIQKVLNWNGKFNWKFEGGIKDCSLIRIRSGSLKWMS